MPAPTRKTKAKSKALPEPMPANEDIRFGRYFLLGVVIFIGVVFFKMISMFLIPIILAAVFCGLFYGFYEKLLRRLRGRRGISAGLCCLLLLLLLLIPLYFLGSLVAQEAVDFYDSAEAQVKEVIAQGDQGLLGRLSEIPLLQRLGVDRIDWQASLQDVFKGAASLIANVINTATKSTFNVIANLFFTLFAMFYFFKDGDRLIAYMKKFSPLPNEYEDQLIRRFLAVSRGTIKGTMLIGLIKGIIGGLTFWIFGIRSPILWAVIMAILSLIPMVGAWLVM
ncbi:MAG TPA: AI-2E family transporter, partial [bacterium]|nr:AI-2E family transporter [bacterium]